MGGAYHILQTIFSGPVFSKDSVPNLSKVESPAAVLVADLVVVVVVARQPVEGLPDPGEEGRADRGSGAARICRHRYGNRWSEDA